MKMKKYLEKVEKNLLNWYAVHLSLSLFTEGDSVVRCRDKMSLLKQLPLLTADYFLWQTWNNLLMCKLLLFWGCSNLLPALFEHIYFNQYISESLFFIIPFWSYASSNIQWRRSFGICRRKEACYIPWNKWSLQKNSYSMTFLFNMIKA